MVNHIVMWKFRQEVSEAERAAIASQMKEQTESIGRRMAAVNTLDVITEPLESSNCDILLLGTFNTEAELLAFQRDPEHQGLKDRLMPFFASRACIDY